MQKVKIKTKRDAERVLEEVAVGDYLSYRDYSLDIVPEFGTTTLENIGNGEYSWFSSWQGGFDAGKTIIDKEKAISLVYKSRKGVHEVLAINDIPVNCIDWN